MDLCCAINKLLFYYCVLTIFFKCPLIFLNFTNLKIFLAPNNYCYSELNKSDCAMPPTPVFTYYKPGSRCEIEIWRGCSTLNKFDNEYECSHYCIGRLSPSFSAEIDNEIVSLEAMQKIKKGQ